MPKKSTLLPLGVLVGVLALSGGVAALTHGSRGAGVSAPSSSAALPAELIDAARATLAHRSLLLTPEVSLNGSAGADFAMRGELDVASGNYRLGGSPAPGVKLNVEVRYVDGVSYVKGGSIFDGDAAVRTLPGKPWTSMHIPAAHRAESDPTFALRLVRDGDPDWKLRSVRPLPDGSRYTLGRAPVAIGEVEQIDLDVSRGEVVRVGIRDRIPELPTCPNVPKAVIDKQKETAAGEAITLQGSERPVRITAPPSDQVQTTPADLSEDFATPPALTCADLPTDLTVVGPPDLPRGHVTYSGPAEPSPAPKR